MSKDNTQDELKAAAEQCFIKNNMRDCGEEHTELSIDDTEYFDVGNVVEDIQLLVKSEVRRVLDSIKEPTIADVFPSKPYDGSNTHSDMKQVIDYYKAAIAEVRSKYE